MWGGRSCGGVDVTSLEVGYQLAIGGDLGGPKAGRFLWIMKRNVPRLGTEIGQAQKKMGYEGSS